MTFDNSTCLENRYQLKQCLGNTIFKQTWLAEDQTTQAQVTVKLLYFGQGTVWQDLKLFEREGQTLQSLNHSRIPCYRDSFCLEMVEGNYFCLVQDYIPGSSLAERVHSGQRFTEEQVKDIAQEVLKILEYLHAQNPPVVHRDIKPQNLIYGEDGHIHLVDFGAVQSGSTVGQTVTVVGTFGYMPPEQFGGRTVPASDLYGLGATLIFLLAGINPSELPQKGFALQFKEQIQSSIFFKDWLEYTLEPDLEKRFKSAEQAMLALSQNSFQLPSENLRTIRNFTPQISSIQIEKDSKNLKIYIPKRNFYISDIIATTSIVLGLLFLFCCGVIGFGMITIGLRITDMFFIGIFLGILVFSILLIFALCYLLISPGLLRKLILSSFRELKIEFNRESFHCYRAIYSTIFKLRFSGKTSNICSVESDRSDFLFSNFEDISLCVRKGEKIQEIRLGAGLSSEERTWLVQEIRSWLQIETNL